MSIDLDLDSTDASTKNKKNDSNNDGVSDDNSTQNDTDDSTDNSTNNDSSTDNSTSIRTGLSFSNEEDDDEHGDNESFTRDNILVESPVPSTVSHNSDNRNVNTPISKAKLAHRNNKNNVTNASRHGKHSKAHKHGDGEGTEEESGEEKLPFDTDDYNGYEFESSSPISEKRIRNHGLEEDAEDSVLSPGKRKKL
ncbi:unnamed protein product [Ambrosiozyma monospora]|uniref:Unnamed protein product n=1 Tax=Ambrosiozyma monospora TaxID=43982 RepID=A0ACB5TDC6_AMBMO|nr:unnamed protein product [Ambrosiozyma monospora]